MKKIRTAVIGVGYLGKFHAEKYAKLADSELIAVCDSNFEQAQEIANNLNVDAVSDYKSLLSDIDAVSIVVPTQLHYEVARDCLRADVHVLLEKPITSTVEQAKELVQIADDRKLKLQIGHLERFNPAVMALENVLTNPQFIESHRIAPFNPRGADVNVILDLMIHDIDIILDLVGSPVTQIQANGVPVLSGDIDVANVRLQFENGCVANVTASRISMKSERKMRIFQNDAYITVDFQGKKLGVHKKGEGEMFPGIPEIDSIESEFGQGDALYAEIESFINCIKTDSRPVVSGYDGLQALETAHKISSLLEKH